MSLGDAAFEREQVDTDQLQAAVDWIALNVIANDVSLDPLPSSLRPMLAQTMVTNPFLGWPTIEIAEAHLEEEFEWT